MTDPMGFNLLFPLGYLIKHSILLKKKRDLFEEFPKWKKKSINFMSNHLWDFSPHPTTEETADFKTDPVGLHVKFMSKLYLKDHAS